MLNEFKHTLEHDIKKSELEYLHNEGFSWKEIAEQLDTSVEKIRYIRNESRKYVKVDRAKVERMLINNIPRKEIAAKLGCSVARVGQIAREIGFARSKKEEVEAKTFVIFVDGKTYNFRSVDEINRMYEAINALRKTVTRNNKKRAL